MSAGEERGDPAEKGFDRDEDAVEEHPLDALAMGMASGYLTRARALKLLGAAFLGGGLSLFAVLTGDADVAEARGRRHRNSLKKKIEHCNRTCNGCCDARGNCDNLGAVGCCDAFGHRQSGLSNLACGHSADFCRVCPSGTSCVNTGVGGFCQPTHTT